MSVHQLFVLIIKSVPFGGAFLYSAYKTLLRMAGVSTATSYFGARFYSCDIQDLVQSRIMMFGIWEPDISDAIEKNLNGGLFVDVGANVGYDTLLASSRKSNVVAIEAAPATFEKLSNNVRKNGAKNVRLVQKAASDKHGELTIYEVHPRNIGAATTIRGIGHTKIATVEGAPLDEILTDEERRQVSFIKIDVEGAELPILNRLIDTLDMYPHKLTLLVEIRPEDRTAWDDLFNRMMAEGFSAYYVHNDYSVEYYLRWRKPLTPRLLYGVPKEQADILFVRK